MSTNTKLAEALRLGREGAPATEEERLLFEAWMRGHCWALCATWDGKQYVSDAEQGGYVDPRAMNTRQIFAAWRDRAALAAHDAEQAQAAQAVPAGYECVTLRAGDYGWRYAVRQSAKLLRDIDRCGGLKSGGEQYPNALCVHDMAQRLDALLAAAPAAPAPAPAPEAPKCPHEGQCHPGFCPCSEAKAQAAGQDERERFEAWAQSEHYNLKRKGEGYAFRETQDAWEAFRAGDSGPAPAEQASLVALPAPPAFPVLASMAEQVRHAIDMHREGASTAQAIGVLEIVKHQLIEEQQ